MKEKYIFIQRNTKRICQYQTCPLGMEKGNSLNRYDMIKGNNGESERKVKNGKC